MTNAAHAAGAGTVGDLLRSWRKARHYSQFALALEAEVSARHLCFIENGRAQPSREMILLLSRVLDVPLRDRNALLLAAGFAARYAERRLGAPELAPINRALEAILRQQEPFPAIVLDRHWDIVATNEAARRFSRLFLGDQAAALPKNLLRRVFDPGAMRPFIANWSAVASALIQRVHRESVGRVDDPLTRALLGELFAYPDVPQLWRQPDPTAPIAPVVPVVYVKAPHRFDFFSTVTTLGTPQDVTAQEIRIECFFPADDATEQAAREM